MSALATLLTNVRQADDTIIYIAIRQVAILRNFVSKCCILHLIDQITEKNKLLRSENILGILLKFQFDRACFHRREGSANVSVSNTVLLLTPIQHFETKVHKIAIWRMVI